MNKSPSLIWNAVEDTGTSALQVPLHTKQISVFCLGNHLISNFY